MRYTARPASSNILLPLYRERPTGLIPSFRGATMDISTLPSNARVRTLGGYLAALALCLLVLGTVLDVGSETRRWPYAYQGDTMFYHVIAKSVTQGGWFLD